MQLEMVISKQTDDKKDGAKMRVPKGPKGSYQFFVIQGGSFWEAE